MTDEAEKSFLSIRDTARINDDILGFVVTGSRGKGFESIYSDFDFAIFVQNNVLEKYKSLYSETPYGAHLYIFSFDTFHNYLSWNGNRVWDKYTWAHLTVEFDRTNGELQQLLDEMSRIPEEQVTPYIDFSLRYFINQVYHSTKCLRVNNQIGYRFEAAEGIKPFLQAVFCLHDRRPFAFYKYLEWELEHYPLTKLRFSSSELLELIASILNTGDYKAQQTLIKEVERIFTAEGYTNALNDWDQGYKWAMNFDPTAINDV